MKLSLMEEEKAELRTFGSWLRFVLGCVFWQVTWQVEMLRSSQETADNTARIAENTRRDQWSDN